MKYDNMHPAVFLSRPNRFIAHILLDGEEKICHVKNTGRCGELLIPGADIIVQENFSPTRKTAFDLISVYKGGRLINMDANAPNRVFHEYLSSGAMGFSPDLIRPEFTHGDSRFDFYYEHEGRRCFTEVKGVTLETDGVVSFPDAPTLRGIKHLRGLIDCVKEGYEANAVFVVQMKDVRHFEPAWDRHPEFARTLIEAQKSGVNILAYDCDVSFDELRLSSPVKVVLNQHFH